VELPAKPMTPDQLRTALASAGISQLELARRIGVDGRTVRYWLAGRAIPDSAVPEIEAALALSVCPTCRRPL
jgi:transcriptional regulator with XRE-family HTH domain